jgi:hypothetical protein
MEPNSYYVTQSINHQLKFSPNKNTHAHKIILIHFFLQIFRPKLHIKLLCHALISSNYFDLNHTKKIQKNVLNPLHITKERFLTQG